MLEKIIDRLLTTITDAFMLFALLVIVGLFYLLVQREKNMKDIFGAIQVQTSGLAKCNESICGVIPLIEILVYGRGGKVL